ncbi:reelin domain-containing protein 1-like [Corythoichthys intestinalis]|uniref:reelin domain-containing protein 1-like n=1 Tax=Corythoichthys intestinalis TaxID=161448 RepID=UPI0025A61995|nr:reelin domain-containing protein 1-like [Corythoichthys intestinalis]
MQSSMLYLAAAAAATTIILSRAVGAFSGGAGPASCRTMSPGHIRVQSQDPRKSHVTVRASARSYLPGQLLTVTVRSSRDFMGFLLQARGGGGQDSGAAGEPGSSGKAPVLVGGSWTSAPPGTHALRCLSEGDTLTHSDKQPKRNLSFVWRAPDAPVGDVRFYITVVQSYFVYWAGISSAVVRDGSQSLWTGEKTRSALFGLRDEKSTAASAPSNKHDRPAGLKPTGKRSFTPRVRLPNSGPPDGRSTSAPPFPLRSPESYHHRKDEAEDTEIRTPIVGNPTTFKSDPSMPTWQEARGPGNSTRTILHSVALFLNATGSQTQRPVLHPITKPEDHRFRFKEGPSHPPSIPPPKTSWPRKRPPSDKALDVPRSSPGSWPEARPRTGPSLSAQMLNISPPVRSFALPTASSSAFLFGRVADSPSSAPFNAASAAARNEPISPTSPSRHPRPSPAPRRSDDGPSTTPLLEPSGRQTRVARSDPKRKPDASTSGRKLRSDIGGESKAKPDGHLSETPGKEGERPALAPGRSSRELGMLLGCSAGLGMALVVGVRYVYGQSCGRRTEVTLNDRERHYGRSERGTVRLQECGDLVRVRRIRENSLVLLAEYDILASPGD